jgi:hypothetical protein
LVLIVQVVVNPTTNTTAHTDKLDSCYISCVKIYAYHVTISESRHYTDFDILYMKELRSGTG